MKKILLNTLILCCLCTSYVYAAELFVRPNTNDKTTDSPAPIAPVAPVKNLEPKPKPAEKAQPEAPPPTAVETIAEFSERYYGNCMKQNHPVLKEQNLQMMCSCTAAKVQESISVEQMKTMQEKTPAGQFARNQMLLNVYAPCIEFPTRALILNQCLNNEQIKTTLKNYQKTCGCLGEGMANYMKDKAPAAIQDALGRNVENYDPLRALLESPEFNSAQQQMLQTCIAQHEMGQ